MDKEYIEEQYKLEILNFKVAKSEDEQWNVRVRMANLERTGIELFGTQFIVQLREKLNVKNLVK